MQTVKVKVFGSYSMNVQAESPKDLYDIIDMHLAMDKKMDVHKVRKGPKKKSQKLLDEGSEAVPAE